MEEVGVVRVEGLGGGMLTWRVPAVPQREVLVKVWEAGRSSLVWRG